MEVQSCQLLMYLDDLSMCLVYCVHDCRSVFHKFPDGIDVVISDEKQIFWPRTLDDLIFECHDHQVIKLQRDKQKMGRPQSSFKTSI